MLSTTTTITIITTSVRNNCWYAEYVVGSISGGNWGMITGGAVIFFSGVKTGSGTQCVSGVNGLRQRVHWSQKRHNTTIWAESGQGSKKAKTLLFISADTLKPIRLECYLPRLSGANKVSLFRADSLARLPAAVRIGFGCRCNRQNVSNRTC